jgi:Zinc knuckle
MVNEQSESGYGTSVRAFAFDGDEAKYRSWEGKTLALAGSKGFLLALTKAGTGRALTVEEYEYGEVEVPGMAVTGGETTAATTRPTTAAENRRYSAKAAAWTYLVASCTDKAYGLIERCAGDPFKAWAILQEKYCATDAEENYPELDQAFSDCKLVGTKKDPELWFNDLDHLNMRLARINLKYEKDDLQMKSHMMTAMSKDYDSVIVKFRGDLSDTPLAKLRKEVVLQFKTLVKDGSGRGSESVLSSSTTFKGTCRNCGKIGHKAHECRAAKVESTDGTTNDASTAEVDNKSNVTCYNCQGKGHYANECASAKNFKSDPTADMMGMFVGASCCMDTMSVCKGYDYGADAGDSFFDNMSDSVAFGEHEDTSFGHLIPACGSGGHTKNDTKTARIEDIAAETEPSAIEVELVEEQESKCDLDVLATDMNTPIMATNETTDEYDNVIVIPSAFVGSAVTLGLAEEMLFNDSGANGGVAYDNKHTTNSTDSNREVTIGNIGKFAALGDDAIKLKDLPDDNVPLDVPGHVSIAEDIPVTMVVTGAATLETGVAPTESFSKILKSLGLIQCKTDPCLFYLFDRYGNLEAMVVACCDDCIATTGREWWVTRLKIGISGRKAMPEEFWAFRMILRTRRMSRSTVLLYRTMGTVLSCQLVRARTTTLQ